MVEEQKAVYFPKGTFIDEALKNSPKQELKDVYNLAEKLNSFIEYQRKYLENLVLELKGITRSRYFNIYFLLQK